MWHQSEITLKPLSRGFHLITHDILKLVPEIKNISIGLCHIHIKHTSASLSLSENADPDVGIDLEGFLNKIAPENSDYFIHTQEGPDDMPAHIKNVLLGSNLQLPITQGLLNLGIWQGIYLCEHRNQGGPRKLVITLQGTRN